VPERADVTGHVINVIARLSHLPRMSHPPEAAAASRLTPAMRRRLENVDH
jgi:hypothetical protein